MKRLIESVLERFTNANLASEAARSKIASEIIKGIALARVLNKLNDKKTARPLTGQANKPADSSHPLGIGR